MLKKLLVIFSVIFSLGFIFAFNYLPIHTENVNLYEIYSAKNSSSAIVSNITNLQLKDAISVKGCSWEVKNIKDIQQILVSLNATEIIRENTEFGESVYAYSPTLPFRKVIDGKVINVQIFCENSRVVVGMPIIYGSY